MGKDRKKKKKQANAKVTRMCRTCNQIGFHDCRKCPSKNIHAQEAMNVQDEHLAVASGELQLFQEKHGL
jgi:hypothetical protein